MKLDENILSGLKRSDAIYRTISLERLFELFATKQNVVVRPKLWDDPFENLALNSTTFMDNENKNSDLKDNVYGQCWTLHTASDAIWRIYSNGTDGVRIKTTVGELLGALAEGIQNTAPQTHPNTPPDGLPSISAYIGKVRYLYKNKLSNFADTHFAKGLDGNGKKIAETLLVKRKAFKHEREVRLVYFAQGSKAAGDIYRFPFDPHKLVSQIMLHPQLTPVHASDLKKKIKQDTGYKGEIKRSLMYQPPKNFVFKIGS